MEMHAVKDRLTDAVTRILVRVNMPEVSERKVLERLRVIIADDDPFARRTVRDALQLAGIVVIAEATDGVEAVELVLHYRPEIVLMDVVMPRMDGIEATRRIISAAPETRVVMLTSTDDDDVGVLGLQAGAVGYLTKDIAPEVIPRVVRGAQEGEAAVSRQLSRRLLERLQSMPNSGLGVRPVRSPLTPREWEVLDLLCAGDGTEQIADRLVLSIETIRSHVKSILRKLGVSSREEAVALAPRLRLPADS